MPRLLSYALTALLILLLLASPIGYSWFGALTGPWGWPLVLAWLPIVMAVGMLLWWLVGQVKAARLRALQFSTRSPSLDGGFAASDQTHS